MRGFLLATATCLLLLAGCDQTGHTKTRPAPSQTPATHQVMAFGADWCPACQRDKKTLAKLERHGITVVRIDADARPDLVAKYKVKRLPTYIVLKDGKEIRRTGDILLLIKILKILLGLLF